ncbi:MAG: hypothetical protein KGM42_20385 [Hyphomicrobiales bacterium]|nr:hypothetical protein [Hyphomicrobiales bacterium]
MFDVAESEQNFEAAVSARRTVAESVRASDVNQSWHAVDARLARSISRAVDLFDDGHLLLVNDRLTSAMVVARSFVEQVAYTARIRQIASECRNDESSLAARLLKLDQSSEQRNRIFKQPIDPGQMYTQSALEKVGTKTPVTTTSELIAALQWALTAVGDTESKARLMYSTLSEWSHPTLFSVVHCYTVDVPPTPTSAGLLSVTESRIAFIRWALTMMILLGLLWFTRGKQGLNPSE